MAKGYIPDKLKSKSCCTTAEGGKAVAEEDAVTGCFATRLPKNVSLICRDRQRKDNQMYYFWWSLDTWKRLFLLKSRTKGIGGAVLENKIVFSNL